MNTVIGLAHRMDNLDSLVRHINSEYGTPKSLMLELPTNWKERRGRITTPKYFNTLAEIYEDKGTRIIAGDRNRTAHEPELSKWMDDFQDKMSDPSFQYDNMKEWFLDFSKQISEIVSYKFLLQKNLLSVKRDRIRNEGFESCYNEENPELTILGDHHARYLKKKISTLNYVFFMINTPYYHFRRFQKDTFRRVNYDKLVVSPVNL